MDSYRDASVTWHPPAELDAVNCPEIDHVGYLIHENADRVILAQGVDPEDPSEVEGKFIIPRGCIISITPTQEK